MLSQRSYLPLHNHFNEASCNSAFYHTGWYCEYRETFRHGLTAESRLHIAMDGGRGSLVKLCGLRRIKFYDLHTSVDHTSRQNGNSTVNLRSVLPATHVVVSWNREDAKWSKYKWNNLGSVWCDRCECDTELKLVLQCYLRVLDCASAPCHPHAVYSWPFGQHQMTVTEIIITVLHRFRTDGVLAYVRLSNCCTWIQSVSNACVRYATTRPRN